MRRLLNLFTKITYNSRRKLPIQYFKTLLIHIGNKYKINMDIMRTKNVYQTMSALTMGIALNSKPKDKKL